MATRSAASPPWLVRPPAIGFMAGVALVLPGAFILLGAGGFWDKALAGIAILIGVSFLLLAAASHRFLSAAAYRSAEGPARERHSR